MQINRLRLRNFRGFEDAEFHFEPGMNLIVGINGAGKSTVLDALRIVFSRVLPEFTACLEKPLKFSDDDIMIGEQNHLDNELEFLASGIVFQSNISKIKGKNNKDEIKPNLSILESIQKKNPTIVVYFSTRRSIIFTGQVLNSNRSLGDQSAAFADALIPRMLRLQEFTDWWLAQEELFNENYSPAKRRIEALNHAVTSFLDWCTNLRVVRLSRKSNQTTLLLDKDGVTLNINQLSEGERGLLALILDLVKRLLQANPDLEDPLKDGKAVVLIDELDLHLHPRWQRMVVKKLTDIFPSCQFIATTHSPQIIGEVDPGNIILLEKDRAPYRPDQSLGMDSNWILRFLMETSERDRDTEKSLKEISQLIKNEEYDEAIDKIDRLSNQLGEFPELVRLQTRIDRIRLLGE
jgi:predicted ATP-binding protein involved in virulence